MKDRCFIIAEAGVNHNGSLALAKRLVDVAKASGADAVKFQTFRAENLVTKRLDRAEYQKANIGGEETQFEMLKRLEISFDDFARLKEYCDRQSILFLSTPFDEESAVFLVNQLGIDRIKISSGELTHLLFLRFLASFGKPLILSTGMGDLAEVGEAVRAIRETSSALPLTLLHCTSNYPCPPEEVNLRAMQTLREAFQVPVGYSDHTRGWEVAVGAVALGAAVIEKHFTLDRGMEGPDHKASLEPEELKMMVSAIRTIEIALGSGEKKPTPSELRIRELARKSLVTTKPLSAGTVLAKSDVAVRRAGNGIAPAEWDRMIGLRLKVDKGEGEPLRWEDLADGPRIHS